MKKSFAYYIVLFVFKLKGLKKTFSQSPIDYKKLRKGDIHFPKNNFFKAKNIRTFTVLNSTITEIAQSTSKLILFIHGGAFISGPSQHHWDTVEKIAKQTNYTIWICNYPKAPEHKISQISENMDAIYNMAIQKFKPENIILIGDSAGATLVISLIQRLVDNKISLPSCLFLISPVMDASLENPAIDGIDHKDPMLSKKGVLSAKKMCAENDDLKNPMISPLFGNFQNFPDTFLFIAENDITFPDQKLFAKKLNDHKIKNTVFIGKEMPHIWPLLPMMKESEIALNEIITLLNKNDNNRS